MSLRTAVETLQGRPLTDAEGKTLSALQDLHCIDDEDPLVIVLALMAQSQLLVGTLPGRCQQATIETIELHRAILKEQSIAISKELITAVAGQIQRAGTDWQRLAGWFIAGMVFMALITPGIRHFMSGS